MLQIILIVIGISIAICSVPSIRRRVSTDAYGHIIWAVFAVYSISNLYFTLFSRVPMPYIIFEWRPFASYASMFQETGDVVGDQLNSWLARFFMETSYPIQTIILNILFYIPLSYLLSELFHKLSNKQILLFSFLATFCTELTQLIFKLGWCETDDLIHNMFGAVIGLAIHRWQEKMGFLGTQNQE